MSENTPIEWTDDTWNPTRGCAVYSKECTNCYAMRQAHRHHGAGRAYEGLTKLTKAGPVWTGAIRLVPELLDWPLRRREPRLIFVDSMSDLFYGDEKDRLQCEKNGVPFEPVPFEFIDQVFGVMAITTRHKYQVLTKRAGRMLEYLRDRDREAYDQLGFPNRISDAAVAARRRTYDKDYDNCGPLWPLENVWIGVSVGDQAAADERIPLLLQAPAAVRWISAEPLLGPIDLERIKGKSLGWGVFLDWVVAGGESGPGARPMHPDWARSLRDQCADAGVAFFFKQWGAWTPCLDSGDHVESRREKCLDGTWMLNVGKKSAGRELDGRTHDGYPA